MISFSYSSTSRWMVLSSISTVCFTFTGSIFCAGRVLVFFFWIIGWAGIFPGGWWWKLRFRVQRVRPNIVIGAANSGAQGPVDFPCLWFWPWGLTPKWEICSYLWWAEHAISCLYFFSSSSVNSHLIHYANYFKLIGWKILMISHCSEIGVSYD